MKRKTGLIALALLSCLCVAGWTARAQRSVKVQWEYKVVFLKDSYTIDKSLNELGLEGWELVAFHMTTELKRDGQGGLFYFKRVRQD